VQIPTEYLSLEKGIAAGGAWEGGKEGTNLVVSVCGQGDEMAHQVDYPAQQFLLRCPDGIAVLQFLEGVRHFPLAVLLIIWLEEQVEGVKDVLPRLPQLGGCFLIEGEEIVHKDVNVGKGIALWIRCQGWCKMCCHACRSLVGIPYPAAGMSICVVLKQ
jgi:hypothetical protein